MAGLLHEAPATPQKQTTADSGATFCRRGGDSFLNSLPMSALMISRSVAAFAALCFLSACATDYTSGRPAVCSVHVRPMERERVEVRHVSAGPETRDYEEIAEAKFPHTRRQIKTGVSLKPWRDTAIVYVCPECEKAAPRWQRHQRRLNESAVIRMADAGARRRGFDPHHFQKPIVKWHAADDTWFLYYRTTREAPPLVGDFGVTIHDKTRRGKVLGGG